MPVTSLSTCPLCEANCGVTVEHEGSHVLRVRGDERDVLSRGFLCPKGAALAELHNDPDRLRRPLRRKGDAFVEVPWDEALDEAGERLGAITREHGRDAVALYIGNPSGHSYGALLYGIALMQVLGTRNLFSTNSVDALPRLLTSLWLYGSQAILPVPDLDRTHHLLILGANPVVSNGSILTAPDMRSRLRAIRQRGGRVVVVDPRRTETAEEADRHVFVRPGGDAALLLGMLHVLFTEGLLRPPSPLVRPEDIEALRDLAARFPPAASEALTGVPAATVAELAREFAAAPSAVCYGRMGTCVQSFGALTSSLIDALNALTGNLDSPGGAMFPLGPVDLATLAARIGQTGHFGRHRSRVRGLPEFNNELPAVTMADEIETPGPGQVRALISHAGNPVLSLPNGPRLRRALSTLEFFVAIDIYRNETTRHAHLILPPPSALEREHYPLLFSALSARNGAKFTPAPLPLPEGARHDWQILLGLMQRLLRARGLLGKAAAAGLGLALGRGPSRLLDLLLRIGPYPGMSLAALVREPHGVDLGPLKPRLAEALRTPDRRVHLCRPELLADATRLAQQVRDAATARATEATAATGAGPLLLIGRRQLRSNNSWMHNLPRLMAGKPRCTLLVHPSDAQRLQLTTGGRARVCSRVGAITVEVEVSEEVMPGVVSLPHGFGHTDPAAALSVAQQHAGQSANDLTDDQAVDAVSGVGVLFGVPVQIEAAA